MKVTSWKGQATNCHGQIQDLKLLTTSCVTEIAYPHFFDCFNPCFENFKEISSQPHPFHKIYSMLLNLNFLVDRLQLIMSSPNFDGETLFSPYVSVCLYVCISIHLSHLFKPYSSETIAPNLKKNLVVSQDMIYS